MDDDKEALLALRARYNQWLNKGRQCTSCRLVKHLSEFDIDENSTDGFSSKCHECSVN